MLRFRNITIAIAALVVFSHFLLSNKGDPAVKATPHRSAPKPLPAGEPTVAPTIQQQKREKQRKKPKQKPKPTKDDYELSTLNSNQRVQIENLVKICASWPGQPQKQLLLKMRKLRPFVTNEAISQIKSAWGDALPTFTLKAKNVVLDPGFVASSGEQSTAEIKAYVTLVRHFKPVSGTPYDQTAIQPYTVSLRVIKRKWRVVAVSLQT
jgi:hypothetical protein